MAYRSTQAAKLGRYPLGTVWGLGVLGAGVLGLTTPAIAADTSLEIDRDVPMQRTLTQGAVSAQVTHTPDLDSAAATTSSLTVELFYDDQPITTIETSLYGYGTVDLLDLDANGDAEVIVQTFTGGAHCCMAITTYTWQNETFVAVPFAYLDGGGGSFTDLNDDGQIEFVSADNAFLYQFSSYAGSYPPTMVLNFVGGTYVDTTAQFPSVVGSGAWRMYEALGRAEADGYEVNGVLAGYVAQKIRLGQYAEGWELMLAHYDEESTWGLEVYDGSGEVVDTYADFPTALAAFLTEMGYLDGAGTPQADVDRSPVVAERMP